MINRQHPLSVVAQCKLLGRVALGQQLSHDRRSSHTFMASNEDLGAGFISRFDKNG